MTFFAIPLHLVVCTEYPKEPERLHQDDSFYIDIRFDKNKIGPKEISISDKTYYRFMDFFYIPSNVYDLTLDQVVKLCELRLKYIDKVVNYDLNANIIKCMTSYIKNDVEINAMQKNFNILDFGCGAGISSKLLAQNLDGATLHGVDVSQKSISLATQAGYDAQCVPIGQTLRFSNEFFDVVFAVFVMHFNIGSVSIREIYRILKKGGAFVFNTYNSDIAFYESQLNQAGFRDLQKVECELPGSHTVLVCTK